MVPYPEVLSQEEELSRAGSQVPLLLATMVIASAQLVPSYGWEDTMNPLRKIIVNRMFFLKYNFIILEGLRVKKCMDKTTLQ